MKCNRFFRLLATYSSRIGVPKYKPPSRPIELYEGKTKADLVKILSSSVIYCQGGIFGINKPNGFPVSGETTKNECFGISSILPELAAELGENQLFLVKSCERDCSGVTILAATKKIEENIKKSFRRAQGMGMCNLIFWAITSGIPSPNILREKISVKQIDIGDGYKWPVVETKQFQFKSTAKVLEHAILEYQVLSTKNKPNCALVKIASYKTKWHIIRIYLTYKAANVIGDQLFSRQVKNVLGVPMVVQPHFQDITEKVISDNFLEILGFSDFASVPLYLHCKEILLPQVLKKNYDVVITAPVPEYFEKALINLELKI